MKIFVFSAHSITYIFAVFMGKNIDPEHYNVAEEDSCKAVIFNVVMYQILNAFLLVRTFITSYMNLKFSRGRQTANKEFLQAVIASNSVQVTDSILEAEAREQIAKSKAQQLIRFYEDYAEAELTRIVTSMMNPSATSLISSVNSQGIPIRTESAPFFDLVDPIEAMDSEAKMSVLLNQERMRLAMLNQRKNSMKNQRVIDYKT